MEKDGDGHKGPALTKVRSSLSVYTFTDRLPQASLSGNILYPHPVPIHQMPSPTRLHPINKGQENLFVRLQEPRDEHRVLTSTDVTIQPLSPDSGTQRYAVADMSLNTTSYSSAASQSFSSHRKTAVAVLLLLLVVIGAIVIWDQIKRRQGTEKQKGLT